MILGENAVIKTIYAENERYSSSYVSLTGDRPCRMPFDDYTLIDSLADVAGIVRAVTRSAVGASLHKGGT